MFSLSHGNSGLLISELSEVAADQLATAFLPVCIASQKKETTVFGWGIK